MPARPGPRVDQLDQGNANPGQVITAGVDSPSFQDSQGGPGGGGDTVNPAEIVLGGGAVEVDLTVEDANIIVPIGTDVFVVTRIVMIITSGGATTDAVISLGNNTGFDNFVSPVTLLNIREENDVHQISLIDRTEVLDSDLVLDVITGATGGALTADVYVHGFNGTEMSSSSMANFLTSAEHNLIDHTGLPGVPAAEAFTSGVHAGTDHAGLPGVNNFDSAAHAAVDHGALAGGLSNRRDLFLPQGFGGGILAPAADATLQGTGILANMTAGAMAGTWVLAPSVNTNGVVLANSGGAVSFEYYVPGNVLAGPTRITAQFNWSGGSGGSDLFIGIVRAATAPPYGFLLNSGDVNSFGIGKAQVSGASSNLQVLHNGGTLTDTGLACSNGSFIVELVENPSLNWTITVYDANSLAVLYGPVAFAAQPAGTYNFVVNGSGLGVFAAFEIAGFTFGPSI